jgi:multidrug transporter EmrE-like cation transporter
LTGALAAFAATALYYLGFAIFKVAADRAQPLRVSRLLHLVWHVLSDWIFLAGLCLVLGGLSLQIVALSTVPLSVAVPIFVSGLVPLLVISVVFFGERLTSREWVSLLLIATAMLLISLSIGSPPPIKATTVAPWKLAAVVFPALGLPLLLMMFGDHRPDGRHARPVTGIAYGLSAGLPVGAAELAIKGWSDSHARGLEILHTPYPYVTVLAAALGFGILQLGFQRSRVSIVATVMTISAKTYLLLVGTMLYGEPWPHDRPRVALRVLGFVVAATAVLLFPRHDDPTAPQPAAPQPSDRAAA